MKENRSNARMLSEVEACNYVGMGRVYFRQWAAEIGARRVFSKRLVRYDKTVIDAALDAMDSHEHKSKPKESKTQ